MRRKKAARILVQPAHIQGDSEHNGAVPLDGTDAADGLSFDSDAVLAQRLSYRLCHLLSGAITSGVGYEHEGFHGFPQFVVTSGCDSLSIHTNDPEEGYNVRRVLRCDKDAEMELIFEPLSQTGRAIGNRLPVEALCSPTD